jgi:hypothetical protein
MGATASVCAPAASARQFLGRAPRDSLRSGELCARLRDIGLLRENLAGDPFARIEIKSCAE